MTDTEKAEKMISDQYMQDIVDELHIPIEEETSFSVNIPEATETTSLLSSGAIGAETGVVGGAAAGVAASSSSSSGSPDSVE